MFDQIYWILFTSFFKDEKILDDIMVAKQASIFDQAIVTIFVHFIYIVFYLVMGILWFFCQKF